MCFEEIILGIIWFKIFEIRYFSLIAGQNIVTKSCHTSVVVFVDCPPILPSFQGPENLIRDPAVLYGINFT